MAVMHDYFVDRLVHTKSVSGLAAEVVAKAAEGGGGLHGITQEEVRGGNAVNLAHALARLGMRTLLVTHSDPVHEPLLRRTFEGLGTELRVKDAPAGLTVAFEGEANVMLGDGGGAADFGPAMLDEDDWEALGRAKVVCSVNWAANRKGTELLSALRERLGKRKTVFFDPADFRDRPEEFSELLGMMADGHLVDWVSMNEHEGRAAAKALGIGSGDLGGSCKALARRLGVRFDLHASRKSYTSDGDTLASAPVRPVKRRRLTGAGDVWDSGTVYGLLAGMKDSARLSFANRAAGLYVGGADMSPPTLRDVRAG